MADGSFPSFSQGYAQARARARERKGDYMTKQDIENARIYKLLVDRYESRIAEYQKKLQSDERNKDYYHAGTPEYQNMMAALLANIEFLTEQMEEAKRKQSEIDAFLSSISDTYIQSIVKLRYLQGLSWQQCAIRTSAGLTADNARMMCRRYMNKQKLK